MAVSGNLTMKGVLLYIFSVCRTNRHLPTIGEIRCNCIKYFLKEVRNKEMLLFFRQCPTSIYGNVLGGGLVYQKSEFFEVLFGCG